jgi:hypothetical protein
MKARDFYLIIWAGAMSMRDSRDNYAFLHDSFVSKRVFIKCKQNLSLWITDYEKPMRTGHKQGEMQLSCIS